jgi:hypothetical protein
MRSIPLRMVPFDAAIVIRCTAKANGPRARETAMLYDHGRTGQRDVRVVLILLHFFECARRGSKLPTGPHIAAFILP